MTTTGQPLVSVLITSYNREQYIGEAIESVLQSTYKNFELIIVDDCSQDSTYQIAKQYAQNNDSVAVYRNDQNLGQFKNRNTAAAYARGKYIKYVDSDDTISKDALSVMVQAMESFPDAGIGLVCNQHELMELQEGFPNHLDSATAYLWHYYKGGILFPGPSGCIFKKDLFLHAGGFPLDLDINADVFLNLKIAAFSSVVLFPTNLVHWRRHNGQVIELQEDYLKMHKERYILNSRILNGENTFLKKRQLSQVKLSCKVLFMRGAVLKVLLKGKVKAFWQIMNETGVSLMELPKVLIPLRFLNPYK